MNMKHIFLIGIIGGMAVPMVYGQTEDEEPAKRPVFVKTKVVFQMRGQRDPLLSEDDMLLMRAHEQQRLALEAAERRRKAEAERRRKEEEERKRQWELLLLKDPTILIRDKIKIGGIIDKEVLIGGKLYTIGNTYMGAKIVNVGPDYVIFSYKGHKFTKRLSI